MPSASVSDGDEREARVLAELPDREDEVLSNHVYPFAERAPVVRGNVDPLDLRLHVRQVAEPAPRLALGLLARHPARDELLDPSLEMEVQFRVHVAVHAIAREGKPEEALHADAPSADSTMAAACV